MNRFILAAIFIMLPGLANATSLDDIYRDLVKSENQGYLPLFVKNRHSPEFLDEERLTDLPSVQNLTTDIDPIYLTNERKLKDDAIKLEEKNWQEAIEAIKLNNVTPKNLEAIEKRVENENPKAIEVYAWMFAKGVGVERDLNKSFELYQKAAHLEIPDAIKNAYEVYKKMTPEQKSRVKALEIEIEEE